MPNIWVLYKPFKKANWHFMLQMWVLQNHFNKTNVYFVTFMQVFHIELCIFEVLLEQYCNIAIHFKFIFLRKISTKYQCTPLIQGMQT